ncbi:hypothetical protein M501DRAFT_872005 [Patellaria atrata CBS 101060]|uniref:Uncharacterized protein n=1 Tax=Patellaria atrata CBS 101060 TaxID=1346257 RepID=A0A9P4S934_9PEZI|nr:hypothetical protein M501DRAFT_872005 [Patellaria atrata CBS 101060]
MEKTGWTIKHGFYVDMGGLKVVLAGRDVEIFKKENTDIERCDDGVYLTIRLEDLIFLVEADLIPLPNIDIHDLEERSKNDIFARVVTLIQVLYFLVYSFGRLGSGLPISTLELSTLAFICCAAFIEYFWWNKPLDLRSATVITVAPDKRERFVSIFSELRFNTPEQDLSEQVDLKLFFDRILEGDESSKIAVHAVWIGCIFNGIHISAWNYSFASDTERLLWHIASVSACGMCSDVGSYIHPPEDSWTYPCRAICFRLRSLPYVSYGRIFCWPAFGSRGVV